MQSKSARGPMHNEAGVESVRAFPREQDSQGRLKQSPIGRRACFPF